LSNFYEFCNGRHEIYYLRKHLEGKPNQNSTVAADLPEEVFIDSTGRPSSRLSSTSSTLKKCKGDKSKVINILRDIQEGCQQKKTKEEHWREREEVRQEKEEERRSMEHLLEAQCKAQEEARTEKEEECKDREDERKAHDHLFNEWECIQMNIQQLRDKPTSLLNMINNLISLL